MSKRKQHQSKNQTVCPRKKLWWIICLMFFAVAGFLGYKFIFAPPNTISPETSAADVEKKTLDPSMLSGRWLRPDGGYVLQLSGIESNGQMNARYFNPRSINVSSARWKQSDSRLSVFVELRDVNYPGCTYDLVYHTANDRMRGIYYQAAMQQQFEVEFVRLK
jgi:hypothetical protein